jgi:hypothetical protein
MALKRSSLYHTIAAPDPQNLGYYAWAQGWLQSST